MSNSVDMALLSFDTTSPQTRPKSWNLQNELVSYHVLFCMKYKIIILFLKSNEQNHIPRIQSAHTDGDHCG